MDVSPVHDRDLKKCVDDHLVASDLGFRSTVPPLLPFLCVVVSLLEPSVKPIRCDVFPLVGRDTTPLHRETPRLVGCIRMRRYLLAFNAHKALSTVFAEFIWHFEINISRIGGSWKEVPRPCGKDSAIA